MKFDVGRASDGLGFTSIETVDINSIEDLNAIAEKYKGVNPKNHNSWNGNHELIIDFTEHTITIYDGYVE